MPPSLPSAFEHALRQTGVRLGDIEGDALPCGMVTLADNPALASTVCNAVAEATSAFPTLVEFVRLPNISPRKPEKPDIHDPQFRPRPDDPAIAVLARKTSPKMAVKLLTARNYNKALKTHEERHQSHERLLLQAQRIRQSYPLDERGYLAWILDTLPADLAVFAQNFFFAPKPLSIIEEDRRKHTFITGGTGSGKSETNKHLIWHYLTQNTQTALVVLDPHDKLAREVARMKPNAANDRLVYIKPGMFKGRYVALNPFDCTAKDEESLNIAQKHFLGAFGQLLGHTLTDAQEAILTPCIGVMLHRDGSTLKDLVRFMDDERNGDLVEYGCKRIPNEEDRRFFQHQFTREAFNPTKQAISYRLNQLIRDPIIRKFLCNPSTFDFESLLEQKKLIVFGFNRDKADEDVVRTIGQLVNAQLMSYAMRRGASSGTPIHLFADECQYFVSPTIEKIMGESRKFQLYATLTTQRTQQVGKPLLDAILGNVGSYLTGRSRNETADKMGKELEIKPDDIRDLKALEFFQSGLEQKPVKTKIGYIGHRLAMPREDWQRILTQQRDRYYRFEDEFTAPTVSEFNRQREQGHVSPAPPQPETLDLPPIPDFSRKHRNPS